MTYPKDGNFSFEEFDDDIIFYFRVSFTKDNIEYSYNLKEQHFIDFKRNSFKRIYVIKDEILKEICDFLEKFSDYKVKEYHQDLKSLLAPYNLDLKFLYCCTDPYTFYSCSMRTPPGWLEKDLSIPVEEPKKPVPTQMSKEEYDDIVCELKREAEIEKERKEIEYLEYLADKIW